MPGALRGNVHWYDYGPVIGAELSDNRPALVISNDVTNRQLELCITVPMSTAMPDVRFRMHHIRIEEADSWASTRQIKSVHQGLLGDLIGRASPDEMNSVILSIAQRLAHQHAPGQIETIQGTFQISAGTILGSPSQGHPGPGPRQPDPGHRLQCRKQHGSGGGHRVRRASSQFTGRSTHDHPGQPASSFSPPTPRTLHRYDPAPPDPSRRNPPRTHAGCHQTSHIADRHPGTLAPTDSHRQDELRPTPAPLHTRVRMPMPQGGIGHAEVEITGAALMLAGALPPSTRPPTRHAD